MVSDVWWDRCRVLDATALFPNAWLRCTARQRFHMDNSNIKLLHVCICLTTFVAHLNLWQFLHHYFLRAGQHVHGCSHGIIRRGINILCKANECNSINISGIIIFHTLWIRAKPNLINLNKKTIKITNASFRMIQSVYISVLNVVYRILGIICFGWIWMVFLVWGWLVSRRSIMHVFNEITCNL